MYTKYLSRIKAIHALVEAKARNRRDVANFRENTFSSQLLKPSEVNRWVEEQLSEYKHHFEQDKVKIADEYNQCIEKAKEYQCKGWNFYKVIDTPTVTLIADTQYEDVRDGEGIQDVKGKDNKVIQKDVPVGWEGKRNALTYMVPKEGADGWVTLRKPIPKRGILWRLKKIALRLVKEYGWGEAQATIFILTDIYPTRGYASVDEPYVPHFSVDCTLEDFYARHPILLSIPLWFTEEDVISLYKKSRQIVDDFLKECGHRLPRGPKSISERTSELVVFVSKRLDESGRPEHSWRSTTEEWNARKDIPADWRYKDWRSMATAFNRARKSLLGI